MICPKCQFDQKDELLECPRCGIVFAKFNARAADITDPSPPGETDTGSMGFGWKDLLLTVPDNSLPLFVIAKAGLLILLAIWGCRFIFASIESNVVGQSFLHLVNLPFHEAGHILFSPFGQFMKTLGGSLTQVLIPAVCLVVLLFKTRDAFGAAVAQWWMGQSIMDMAPYINDARALKLILLGGVTGRDVIDYHDWEYLLRTTGLLKMDHALAWTAHGAGAVIMLAAITWGAVNVWMQWRSCRGQSQQG